VPGSRTQEVLRIADSGTKRVYQFDSAAGLTSGNLYPSTFFALAAGNTNPQGIADPPSGVPIPVASTSAPLPAPSQPIRGCLSFTDPSLTFASEAFVPLATFDQALDTLHPVAPQESVLEMTVPEMLRARRRRSG
jgi:hypothetical protein